MTVFNFILKYKYQIQIKLPLYINYRLILALNIFNTYIIHKKRNNKR